MAKRSALLLLSGLWLAGALSAQQTPAPAEGTMQPGDVLKVQIWREEDLSGEFVVDESGVVTLPMLGPRRAAGVPVAELRRSLLEEFGRQLNNPSIQIIPLRRVFVLGAVGRPGAYALEPTVSLAGVVALAGGATPVGDLNRIRIVRNGEVFASRVAPAASLNTMDVRSGDQIFVGERSWLSRNSTFLVSALLSVTGIVVSIVAASS